MAVLHLFLLDINAITLAKVGYLKHRREICNDNMLLLLTLPYCLLRLQIFIGDRYFITVLQSYKCTCVCTTMYVLHSQKCTYVCTILVYYVARSVSV